MKASDIPDSIVLAAMDAQNGQWATIGDVKALVPKFPYKVVQAKCSQMIAKGRIGGCGCGCRGDLHRFKPGCGSYDVPLRLGEYVNPNRYEKKP